MRERLRPHDGKRITVRATIECFGTRNTGDGGKFRTMLLKDITDSDRKLLCDHVWVQYFSHMDGYQLIAGERIEFTCEVYKYWRASDNKPNYGFRRIQKLKKLFSRVSSYAYMG